MALVAMAYIYAFMIAVFSFLYLVTPFLAIASALWMGAAISAWASAAEDRLDK
jgi:hypothetical protein